MKVSLVLKNFNTNSYNFFKIFFYFNTVFPSKMATLTLQQRFNNFSDKIIRVALRALENENDSDSLEM